MKDIGKKSAFSPYYLLKNLFKKPITIRYPYEDLDVFPDTPGCSPFYRGLHTNDLEKCIGCGTCADICPTTAIKMVKVKDRPELDKKDSQAGRTGEHPEIDYGRCCFCAMCVDVCTSSSLKMSRDYLQTERIELFLDGPTEVNKLKDKFTIIPDETHGTNIGFDTPDELSWLDLERIKMRELKPKERNSSFIEIVRGFSKEEARKEASRCVECGVCKTNCPASMDIPEYIKAIWEDKIDKAGEILYKTNPLPGVCGRICTHKCEAVCSLSIRGEAVSIRWLKRYIVDTLEPEKLQTILKGNKLENKNKKIAIIGSGPSGLSAAYYLGISGYSVDIFEEMSRAGGILRYGIPAYRLPDSELDKDIAHIEKIGVKFHFNKKIGRDIKYASLRSRYDAVYISIGLTKGKKLNIPGSDNKNVYTALELLRTIREGLQKIDQENIKKKELVKIEKFYKIVRSITVIGGGNVAFDIARTLARLQKIKYGRVRINLVCLEPKGKMLADDEEITEGIEEGIIISNSLSPISIKKSKGNILELETHKCLSIFDADGKFNPQLDHKDIKKFKSEHIVFSIGQVPDVNFIDQKDWKIIKGFGNRILVDEKNATSIKGLFAGGDIVKGPDAISGIADGHRAALSIDEYLRTQRNIKGKATKRVKRITNKKK